MDYPDNDAEGDTGAPPDQWVEQLRAWHKEIEDARLQLEQESMELEREIECHRDGGHACTIIRDINQRIIEDNGGLSRFTRASQNIAAAVVLL